MKQLLYMSIKAATAAGKEIMSIYNDPNSDFSIETKSDSSPLTIADKRSHEVIESLLNQTPYPTLSEEGKTIPYDTRKEWGSLWIVDPLDGTKEFIKRNGEFTVNIALVRNGSPILGVIYVPVTNMLYFGAQGAGAFRINLANVNLVESWESILIRAEKLPLTSDTEERPFKVVASRSHMSTETQEYIAALEKEHGNVELVASGSSLKICLVAEGSADTYPRFAPTMEWDTAAGHAIAIAAGRNVYNTQTGEPLAYNKEDLVNPWFIVR